MTLIAIDGPGGAGKSTLARALAERLGIARLDTGAMYRAVAWLALREQIADDDEEALAGLAKSMVFAQGERVDVNGLDVTEDLRSAEVSAAASLVAAHPAVRAELVRRQREWIAHHDGGVIEGRDIGSVVAPDAQVKIYLTAEVTERGRRRARELGDQETDSSPSTDAVTASIAARDANDETRPVSPLVVAPGAVVIDSTKRSIDDIVEEVLRLLSGKPGTDTPKASMVPLGARIFYGICRFIIVGISRFYFPGRVLHRERLPRTGAYILAPVHRSYVDWLVVARVTKHRLRYLVKGEVWKVAAVGKFIELLGAFPVHRGAADREAMQRALAVLELGEPLVMFPEGTRRHGALVEDLREGAAYVALRAGVPIVPVGIGRTERSMPKGAHLPRPTRSRVVIGEPLLPIGRSDQGRVPRSAIRELTSALQVSLQELYDEAEGRSARAE